MANPTYFSGPEPSPVAALLARLHADALAWCAGRNWLLRLPLLLWLAYVGARQFFDADYSMQCLFAAINLGIHEGGHLLAGGLGEFLCAAAGSLLQCLVPVIAMYMFVRQRDYFGIAVCFGWLSTNLVQVGVYMSDARKMALPLVTVGPVSGDIERLHDWHFLFARLGLLGSCETIGAFTRLLGHASMLACLGGGAWLLWQMFAHPRPARPT